MPAQAAVEGEPHGVLRDVSRHRDALRRALGNPDGFDDGELRNLAMHADRPSLIAL